MFFFVGLLTGPIGILLAYFSGTRPPEQKKPPDHTGQGAS